jgi:integrase/recombinase XerD
MTDLANAASDYLRIRRALGFKLTDQGRLLNSFIDHMQSLGAVTVTTERALAWATQPAHADPVWWSARLGVVRGFARYLQSLDPSAEVPPAGLLPDRNHRTTPYIYSQAEIAALLRAARQLSRPLRAATYETLFGLLATTGMRIGEATVVDQGDIDFDLGLLTIHHGKFNKARIVPLHPSTLQALHNYSQRRRELCPGAKHPSFFVSSNGSRLTPTNADKAFGQLLGACGVQWAPRQQRPRPHDLRHTFAVRTMIGWYRDGADVQERMPLLSTYLGHANPDATYWYLTAVPELLALAAQRLEVAGGKP